MIIKRTLPIKHPLFREINIFQKNIMLLMGSILIGQTNNYSTICSSSPAARHMKPEAIQTLHRTTTTSISNSTKTSDSSITLKIQSSLWKKPIQLAVEPNKRLIVLVIHCAQQLNCEPDRLRLRFDGEALDLQQTAADLDLEGGEMLDLWMVD